MVLGFLLPPEELELVAASQTPLVGSSRAMAPRRSGRPLPQRARGNISPGIAQQGGNNFPPNNINHLNSRGGGDHVGGGHNVIL